MAWVLRQRLGEHWLLPDPPLKLRPRCGPVTPSDLHTDEARLLGFQHDLWRPGSGRWKYSWGLENLQPGVPPEGLYISSSPSTHTQWTSST